MQVFLNILSYAYRNVRAHFTRTWTYTSEKKRKFNDGYRSGFFVLFKDCFNAANPTPTTLLFLDFERTK